MLSVILSSKNWINKIGEFLQLSIIFTSQRKSYTVEPPIRGHPQDQKKCLCKRRVRVWEVKIVVFVCSWVHDQVSAFERCPPTGCVH